MKNSNTSASTLVEVIAATAIFVSVVTLITTILAGVFEGYGFTKDRGFVDQDGRYILAKIQQAALKQDPQTLISQSKASDFQKEGAIFQNTLYSADNGGLIISGGSTGTYTSAIFSLGTSHSAKAIIVVSKNPSEATIKSQVALAKMVDGSCSGANYVFVGPDKTSDSYFDTEISQLPNDSDGIGYENPAECIRYKIYFTQVSSSPVVKEVIVQAP